MNAPGQAKRIGTAQRELMPLNLYIKTFGCQMNEYDSAKTAELLAQTHDARLTEDPARADVLLLNTCSIRDKAEEKVYSWLGQWRLLKERRPGVVIGVGGCVASQEGEALRARAPFVDIVYGPQTLHRVSDMLSEVLSARQPRVDVSFPELEKFDCLAPARAEGPSSYVSIMEGCSKYCSFCVVPYTRGAEFSRGFDEVVAEVVALAGQGVREVTFLGQNVNAYRGAMHGGGVCDLAELVGYCAEVDGIDRIRFTTSHPAEFDDALIDAYARVPELASHLHLPVQSGSDRILGLMKRPYTAADFRERVARLREARPGVSVSSDFIVGFPGEREEDFEATLELVRAVGFDGGYSFLYSPRPGTPAAALPDAVPLGEKKRRLERLQRLLEAQAAQVSTAMVGGVERVLVDAVSKKSARQMSGRTQNNRVVNFDAEPELLGRFAQVRITQALSHSLRGRLVSAETGAGAAA